MRKITNPKLQITNKFQYSNSNDQNGVWFYCILLHVLNFGPLNLEFICNLELVFWNLRRMRLYHRHYGEGKPLIILHGLFGLSDNWVTFAKQLGDLGYEVSIPDQRNHGRSPHSDTFNYLALTDDLMEFIEEHNIEDPVLLGHSMGGKVAMRFALENPGIIDRLVVVDISLRKYENRHHHKKIIQAMRGVSFNDVTKLTDVEDQLAETIPEKRIRQFIMKNLYYRDNRQTLGWRINFESICESIEEMFDGIDITEVYNKPALLVRGSDSDYVTDEDIKRFMFKFPNSQIHTIKGASHWVHAEKPQEFLQITSQFLNE